MINGPHCRKSKRPSPIESFKGNGCLVQRFRVVKKTIGVDWCERFAQSRYTAAPWQGIELSTS